MKVFIVCDYFPPSKGGIQTHCYELAEHLKGVGADVTVYTKKMDRNKNYIKEVPFINIKYIRGFSSIVLLAIYLIKGLIREKPDIIHSHSYQPTIASIIAKTITRSKTPIIMTSHGIVAESTVIGRPFVYRKLFGFITKSLEIVSIKKANFIISVDKLFESYALKHIKKDKIEVISNWVNTDMFNKLNRDESIDSLKNNDIIICCPRRLDKKNGLEYSIQSFALLSKKIKNIKLWFVGGGDYEGKLRELVKELGIENKVIFFGYKPREEIPHYINASDIVLLTSKLGNFCFTLLEALSCGKTVVATVGGDTLDFEGIDEGVMVLCNHDTSEIANTLEKVISKKYNLEKLQENAVEVIREKYSKEKVIGRIENVYSRFLKTKA